MSKLTFELPINSVSFGQVSVAILRELYNKNLDINVFEISGSDLSAQKEDVNFSKWLENAINKARLEHNKNIPVFKLWHMIHSFQGTLSKFNSLYTFHETDRITDYEKTALNCNEVVFVSSNYTKDIFKSSGIENVIVTPVGFDSHNFQKVNKKFYQDDRIVWNLVGKAETRKNTFKIINLWAKRFGNNPKHILHLLIDNHFVNQAYKDNDATKKILIQTLGGKQYNNINWLHSVKSNNEVNDIMNAGDIDLSGLSSCEGWGIPYFNSLCLGKHGIALNAHANKMFANNENSVLVESNGMVPAEDGIFFIKGGPQNQGQWHGINDDDIISAMDIVAQKAKTPNLAGEKLKDIFTMENMVNIILNNIKI